MELNSEIVTDPPRDAATVVLLRDSADGLQVLMMQRHNASQVLGGVHVFPGGKLDDADMSSSLLQLLQEDSAQLHHLLNEPALEPLRAAGLYVAALRELHEEAGILLGNATAPVNEAGHWAQAVTTLGHKLQASLLTPWSRWITPKQPSVTNKRFDTRFFVAVLPDGQHPMHDNIEAIDSVWLTPLEALTRYWAGDLPLAPPQIMTLASLLSHRCSQDVLNFASTRQPPTVLPEAFDDEGVRTLCYPGDPRHSVAMRAMPGPTRLRFVAGRFEPPTGFEEFV